MPLADRIRRHQAPLLDVAALKTGITDVVTIRGSLDSRPDVLGGEELVQDWMVPALDKGTRRLDRFEIADELENMGARIGFSSSSTRVRFSARCLKADLDGVLRLMFEQLFDPAFDEAELTKGKDRLLASVQRGRSDAGYRSDVALAGHVFPPGHPGHALEPDTEMELVRKLSPDQARSLHQRRIATAAVRIALVGDIDEAGALQSVAGAMQGVRGEQPEDAQQSTSTVDDHRRPPTKGVPPITREIPLADRDNLEVRWGHPMPVLRTDDGYLATYLASFILGGNFSGRLMEEVRDRRGLTYGVGSGLRGVDANHYGMWRTYITLSAEKLAEGIEATEAVIRAFCDSGVSQDECARAAETVSGSFKVALATTGGLAGSMLQRMEDGRPMTYIDDYPALIQSVTLAELNDVIQSSMDPDALSRTVAGTLPTETA